MSKPTVAIVGLGLIGGSLARSLSRAGYRVLGVDRGAVRRRAQAAGAVVETFASPVRAASRADVLVLAAPPTTNLRLLQRLAKTAPAGVVITDVGSVKGPIVREARRLGLTDFVGGHPIAGSEGTGFGASSSDLFRGCPWILCPAGGSPRASRVVRALVRSVGARAATLPASDHDRAMAFLSHVPQVVSWALLEAAQRDSVAARHLRRAGPGFRDMTRLAQSPRPLWREIVGQNRSEVSRALRAFRRALRDLGIIEVGRAPARPSGSESS